MPAIHRRALLPAFLSWSGVDKGRDTKTPPGYGGVSQKLFGGGLLSHMMVCSSIGDGELNFRVRNGVGCTLSSMAAKEMYIEREEGFFSKTRRTGY